MAGASLANAATPQLSAVTGVPSAMFVTECPPGTVFVVRSGGQVMLGGSWSNTVTANVQLLWLPLASVATAVTRVTPTGKVLPLGGTLTTVGAPQLSAAVMVKVTLLRLHLPASDNCGAP